MKEKVYTRVSKNSDVELMGNRFRHISKATFETKLKAGEYLLVFSDDVFVGWLRWGYFWDSIPSINMLMIDEGEREKGYGRRLVSDWEKLMREDGHEMVMTSTQSDEDAQHFYRRLGFVDRGSIMLPDEVLEIILVKYLLEEKEKTIP